MSNKTYPPLLGELCNSWYELFVPKYVPDQHFKGGWGHHIVACRMDISGIIKNDGMQIRLTDSEIDLGKKQFVITMTTTLTVFICSASNLVVWGLEIWGMPPQTNAYYHPTISIRYVNYRIVLSDIQFHIILKDWCMCMYYCSIYQNNFQ